ncbi:hypothetical protein [Nocardia carnea]|uniref:hypothetical protein n=1 Tax=Nocardia carnea TaxID=37328 RepID=UPI002457E177|nr:hypothetical protein [Nocardia carnea]
MTTTLATPPATPALATVDLTVSPFAYALWEVDYLLDTNPARARRMFADALSSLACPAEREFLERAASMLSYHPWPVAARELGWLAKSRPELRDMVVHYTTDTDPGLHYPPDPRISEVPIEATEWVRQSIRERHDRDRFTATPSRATDTARLRPEAVAYRRARLALPPTAGLSLRHRDRDRRTAARREAVWAAYAGTRLFAIDTDDADRDAGAVSDPRKRGDLIWSHVQAGLWDRSYFLHVAANYTDRDRDLLDPEPAAADRVRSGRHSALDTEAAQFLRGHGVDPGDSDDHTTSSHRPNRPRTRGYVRVLDQNRFAQRRTGLAAPSDYDEYRPYTELDEPEPSWQGSGLDYDLAAMVPYLGWPCIHCWIDRADIDRRAVHIRDGRLVSDDGLCDFCRDAGHAGIPPLPAPWGGREFVESRCAYIAATYPRQARALLDRIRAAAANSGPTWRLITRWMATHLDQPAPARSAARPTTGRPRQRTALGAGQRIGHCDACARNGVVHADNLCTQCRVDLGLVPPREHTTSAA